MQLKQLDMDSASEAKKEGEGHEWSTGDDLANGELPGTVILPAGWYAHGQSTCADMFVACHMGSERNPCMWAKRLPALVFRQCKMSPN